MVMVKVNMKSILFLFVISAFLTNWSVAQTQADLTVRIEGIKPADGEILVALHNRAASFSPSPQSAFALRRLPLKKEMKEATLTFQNIPAGDYAVSVLLDENGNKKMDFKMLGMPKEGYGVSNLKSKYRRPDFDESKFRVAPGNNTITIGMVYF